MPDSYPPNNLVAAPGESLYLGSEGGSLLLQNAAPGAMSLTDMQNRTWHLLREPGPDTGQVAPTVGDFNISVVTRDLNIAMAQFISQCGIAPALTDRFAQLPVFPVLDYPLPPDLVGLLQIEYVPNGQYPYVLQAKSITEFNQVTGYIVPPVQGQPRYFRAPFAGYIRLQPQPGPGNATGPASGTLTFSGYPNTGQVITIHLSSGNSVVVVTYTVLASDTLNSVATNVSAAINASAAVQGSPTVVAFLAASTVTNYTTTEPPPFSAPTATVGLTAGTSGTIGLGYSYYIGVTNPTTGLSATPTASTFFQASGDMMNFYYKSLGTVLVNPNDVPTIPNQFHMAPVYRVLADYWLRKQDQKMAELYMGRFKDEVVRGKSFVYDQDESTQPTLAGDDTDDYPVFPSGIG